MGNFGNVNKIIDAEKEQKIKLMFDETEKVLQEAMRQINIARSYINDIEKLRG